MNTQFLTSFDIFKALYKSIDYKKDNMWWPNYGTFEVVISTILAQNTKFKNVEKSLLILREKNITSLDSIINIDIKILAQLIKSSGFYNTKAKYIKNLSKNIKKDFENFENFSLNVDREWLCKQKGISFESADSILCYACLRDEMVADSYSHRLLLSLGIELESYEDVKYFLSKDLENNLKDINLLCDKNMSLNNIYALFHALIVEYCILYANKKSVDVNILKENLK